MVYIPTGIKWELVKCFYIGLNVVGKVSDRTSEWVYEIGSLAGGVRNRSRGLSIGELMEVRRLAGLQGEGSDKRMWWLSFRMWRPK